MRHFFLSGCILALAVAAGSADPAHAQMARGNTFLMVTTQLTFPENGSPAEFDSLSRVYSENVVKKVDLVISYRRLRHWFGANSMELIELIEVKEFADVAKLGPLTNEQMSKAFPSAEAREKFNKAFSKYTSGRHSDNILSEVVGTRK